jgi:hypothetical protein
MAAVMSEELVQISVKRYRDPDGKATCASDKKACQFFRIARFGTVETCHFDERNPVSGGYDGQGRRGADGRGSLIPGSYCPVWEPEEVEP